LSGVIEVGDVKVELIWFDSLGAKSSTTLVTTPDVKILIDPGAAEMQPSYPLSWDEKYRLLQEALEAIIRASREADVITVTHYHYDHHLLPKDFKEVYEGKLLLIKDPNKWINESQWDRARLFLTQLIEVFTGSFDENMLYTEAQSFELKDPLEELPIAASKDYGDYNARKRELLEKGREWLKKLHEKLWQKGPWCKEVEVKDKFKVVFADGLSFKFSNTELRFTKPFFHGVEYDRVGWTLSIVVEHPHAKIVHSSDLQGPVIEDYAKWIIDENPDILILDGPPTYLLGYMFNNINLRRAVQNTCKIIEETSTKLIIYDHHLTRDKLYPDRVADVYATANKLGKKVLTAAEQMGKKPLILTIES